ncbi:MAG: acetoin utilization protein AcuC [Acidobacteriia bacterium]|nr:acetoin utilization protein AcuC [Terriglobia bacterium]
MVIDVYDPNYLAYDFGPAHPFSPVRLEMLLDLLHELGHPVGPMAPQPVSREDLLTVHSEEYVSAVEEADRGEPVTDPDRFGLGTPDNPVFPGMDQAARYLVGGTLLGAHLLFYDKAQTVIQLGGGMHHAQRDRASGFCVYNDLAVAIRYLLDHGATVAYLDIDVHHGDGVQTIFYDEPSVLTISLHESGQYLFPGTGEVHELGKLHGRGRKLNVPLAPFTEADSYLRAFSAVVPQALAWFRPDFLVVQAGADAHAGDPLADLLLTTQAFETLFQRCLEYADKFCRGRVLFTLGGGYDVHSVPRIWALLYLTIHGHPVASELPASWRQRWQERLGVDLPAAMHDPNPAYPPVPLREEIADHNRSITNRLLDSLMPYWYGSV